MKNILVTGGAGYIGSHCVKILQDRGYTPIALDNLVKGHKQAISNAKLYIGDIADRELVANILREHSIDAVMHFAAYSLVGESQSEPYKYYMNNVTATANLLQVMVECDVKRIVFSSTAATYGSPKASHVTEDMPQNPINTYGETKLAMEHMMTAFDRAHSLRYTALRYFNVAGAYETGEIGEDHTPETHLIPNVLAVANGKRDKITIFGDDYNTPDGTNIRDYLHVVDLIDAHIKALEYLLADNPSDCFNLGSGGGYSNLEILNAARKVTGHAIPSDFGPRRDGDPDVLVAASQKAESVLNWHRQHESIEDIIASAWKWHKSHPNGYQ
ncbi:MAG: UDP-glucose 4-epimerase GalE [Oscillospiraceae bacterium]|nr:UDP-glucose 4-epimerase GalE [Oscillospiraceae bacterium]